MTKTQDIRSANQKAASRVGKQDSCCDAKQAVRLTEGYLAVVSHELRTPLSAILNWVQVLRNSTADPVLTSRAATVIERSARLQSKLINDLLDVSRAIGGKMQLAPTVCDLDDAVRASLAALKHDADAKRITLSYAGCDSAHIFADERRLQQVMLNLLGNAIKFTPPEGTVTINVRSDGAFVTCEVADTGCGFAPDLLPHIFERFRQADQLPAHSTDGLGLGLHIVKTIVELHRGTIRAHSDGPDQGATFTIRIPIIAKAESKIQNS